MSNDSGPGSTLAAMPNELQQTLGDRLRKSMEYAGYSIEDARLYLGVHRNSVSSYINDRTPVPSPVLRLWAIMTHVPLQWLETGMWPELEPPAAEPKKRPARVGRRTNRSTAAAEPDAGSKAEPKKRPAKTGRRAAATG